MVATLETDGTFSSSSSSSTGPSLAFLDLEAVGSRRDRSIRFSRCDRVNSPVVNLERKQQRRLRPTNELEDPYIVAVLIALAQQRQHHQCQCAGAKEKATDTSLEDIIPPRTGPTPLPFSEATRTSRETAGHFKVRNLFAGLFIDPPAKLGPHRSMFLLSPQRMHEACISTRLASRLPSSDDLTGHQIVSQLAQFSFRTTEFPSHRQRR